MADEDLQRRLKEAHSVITEIARNGASREEADIVARQKYNVTLDDVLKYDDSQRGMEVWGIPIPRNVGAAVVGYGQGLTSNWGDELRGRIKQGAAYLTGEDPQAAYDQEVSDTRAMESSLRDTNPVPYYAGQVGGGINQALVVPGAASTKALPLGTAVLRGAGQGAIQGAVAGAGAADGDLADRSMGLAIGGAVGGLTGAALPVITRGAGKVYDAGKSFFQDFIQPKVNLAPAAVQGADAVQAAVTPTQPITVGASDRSGALDYIARNMERDQLDSQGTSAALDAMGSRGRLADIGPNLRDAAGAVISQPGRGKSVALSALEGRQAGQQSTLLDAAQTALSEGADDASKFSQGFHEAGDALVEARKAASDPAYEAFRQANGGVTWSDDLAKLFQRPALKKAWKHAQDIAGNEGVDLPLVAETDPVTGDVTKWTGIPDNRTLDYIKRGLDDVIEGSRDARGKITTDSGRSVESLKRQFLDIVDKLNPAYAEARQAFSGPSESLRALEKGRAFLKDDAEITAAEIAKMGKGDKEFFRIGVLRDLADIIKSNPTDRSVVNKLRATGFKEKLAAAFPSEEAYNKFVQTVENEARFAGTRASTAGNSATAQRLSSAADMNGNLSQVAENLATGNTPGLVRQAWQWLQSDAAPSEKERAVLADLLLRQGPDAIKKLLPDIERRRLVQALTAGAGSAARSATGQQAAGGIVRAQGQGRSAP